MPVVIKNILIAVCAFMSYIKKLDIMVQLGSSLTVKIFYMLNVMFWTVFA